MINTPNTACCEMAYRIMISKFSVEDQATLLPILEMLMALRFQFRELQAHIKSEQTMFGGSSFGSQAFAAYATGTTPSENITINAGPDTITVNKDETGTLVSINTGTNETLNVSINTTDHLTVNRGEL